MSSAKLIETTGDVTRFRGVWAAALLAALTCVVASIAMSRSGNSRGAPGALSQSHAEAGLRCSSCHGANKAAATQCDGCHSGYTSLRAPHASLLESGAMECSSCHQGHGGDEGVVVLADGRARRNDSTIANGSLKEIIKAYVPVIPVERCSQCHAVESARDPIAICLVDSEKLLGSGRSTLCLDEHVKVGGARDAAWEMTRQTIATTPPPRRQGQDSGTGPWSWIGMGSLAGLGMIGLFRLRSVGTGRDTQEPTLRAPEVLRLPVVNAATCLGCHACVDACPFDVLEIRRYVAVVARPAACCGLTLCEQRCPNGSLTMGDGTEIEDAVALNASLQSEHAPGIYLAGDVTGLPLIRNAINQGAHAMRSLASELGPRDQDVDFDVVIVGAGPAGISACLEAKSLGLRYLVLEQGTVAGSIQSFPRAKLVFDQPLDLPLVGKLWLEESTKEELLARWLRIVRSERLDIREGLQVTKIDARESGFRISARVADAPTEVFRTKRVLLAIGKRGSSRKLPIEIPETALDKVFYSLADARAFAGQHVVVVGLGDVAMEAAIALSRQPATKVIVSHRGTSFSRGKSRNIEELQRRVRAGAVDLRMQSTVTSVSQTTITMDSPEGEITVPCDGVFVLIGTTPPIDFLTRVGVMPNTANQENKT